MVDRRIRGLNQPRRTAPRTSMAIAYNRAFNTNATNYNQFNQNQTNAYNRLAGISGTGQETAQQLGLLGQQASNAVGQNLMGTASAMGQDYQNAAAANASGYIGAANAWGGALSNGANSLQQYYLLQQLQGQQPDPSYDYKWGG